MAAGYVSALGSEMPEQRIHLDVLVLECPCELAHSPKNYRGSMPHATLSTKQPSS